MVLKVRLIKARWGWRNVGRIIRTASFENENSMERRIYIAEETWAIAQLGLKHGRNVKIVGNCLVLFKSNKEGNVKTKFI